MKEGAVESVAFSPDGKTIAAGYGDSAPAAGWCCGTWPHANALVDDPLRRERGLGSERGLQPRRQDHRGRICRRRRGNSGGVVLWDVDLESWQRRAGRIANRNFTREEWREYFPETPYRATFPDLPVPPEWILR